MKDRISALMDGELDERAAAQAIDAIRSDRQALDAWRTYHLVGDAMRGACFVSEGFVARVAERIVKEPTVLAPRQARPESRKWIALSAAASIAAVALVGWVAFGPQQESAQVVARAPQVQPAARRQDSPPAVPATVPFTSATNDYLLAHQGFSSRISLQGLVPYVRTVSDSSQEAGK